jgi:hypothetical protein
MRFCDGCGTRLSIVLVRKQRATVEEGVSTRKTGAGPAGIRDILLMAVLFIITAVTIFPFFFGDITQNFGSIESAYISDSSFLVNSFPNLGWYPFWYGGFPFHLSYPPLFVGLVAALHIIFGLSIGQSYRVLGGIGYAATPVALYILSKSLTKNRVGSFCAGLTYGLVPTFFPAIAPPRAEVLALYGEAPHLFGFALALMSIYQLFNCISRPTWPRCALAAVLMAGVALSNLIALYGLSLLLVAAVLTEIVYRSQNALSLTVLIGIIAYGISAFQYDPAFIRSSAQYGQLTGSGINPLQIAALGALFVGLVLIHRSKSRLLSKHTRTKVWFFCATWLAVFFLVIAGSHNWFGLPALAPQGSRYEPELDAGVSLFVGLLIIYANKLITHFLMSVSSVVRWGSHFAVLGVFLAGLLIVSAASVPHSLAVTQPTTNLDNVPEYRIAAWLSQHVTDESVFATGTVGFWLDVFSNVREIRGGSDQGATNPWWNLVASEINAGPDPQTSILLAQAWNVKYIVVTFPNASTVYHDFAYPEKFQNVLPLSYYFMGNGVYEIPLRRPSLIEAVSGNHASNLPPITSIFDSSALSRYVDLTQNSTNDSGATTSYSLINPDLYHVSVSNASQDTAILVKMTYDPAWHVEMNGMALQVLPIGLDFMIIYPQTAGNYSLDLHYDRSLGQTAGSILTILTLGLMVAITLMDFRMRRSNTVLKRERAESLLTTSSTEAR